MQYDTLNNEATSVTIYRDDNLKTEIFTKDDCVLLVVVDTSGVLLVYEIQDSRRKQPLLHSGYRDWVTFETNRVGGE